MEKISVVIIDNHPVVRQGLTTVLKKQQNMEVVGESEAVTSALPVIKNHKPDVAIVDSSMTDICGADLIPEIRTLSKNTAVIIYSTHQKHEPIFRAFKAGAKGYVFKADEVSEVIDAIDEVQQGRIFLSHNIPNTIAYQLLTGGGSEGVLSSLSPREYEIAKLLSQCMTPHDIGAILFISPRTVRVHRSNMMNKLNCKKANELLVLLRDCFSH
jgi:DNA-binding NarL/FixJ family response regulator